MASEFWQGRGRGIHLLHWTNNAIIDNGQLERTGALNVSHIFCQLRDATPLLWILCPSGPQIQSFLNPPLGNRATPSDIPYRGSEVQWYGVDKDWWFIVSALFLCHRLLTPACRTLLYSRHGLALCWCCVSTLQFWGGGCEARPPLNSKSSHWILKQTSLFPLFFSSDRSFYE